MDLPCKRLQPRLSTHEMTKAVTRHRKECHPELLIRQWIGLMCSARFRARPASPKVAETRRAKGEKNRAVKFKTHKPARCCCG